MKLLLFCNVFFLYLLIQLLLCRRFGIIVPEEPVNIFIVTLFIASFIFWWLDYRSYTRIFFGFAVALNYTPRIYWVHLADIDKLFFLQCIITVVGLILAALGVWQLISKTNKLSPHLESATNILILSAIGLLAFKLYWPILLILMSGPLVCLTAPILILAAGLLFLNVNLRAYTDFILGFVAQCWFVNAWLSALTISYNWRFGIFILMGTSGLIQCVESISQITNKTTLLPTKLAYINKIIVIFSVGFLLYLVLGSCG